MFWIGKCLWNEEGRQCWKRIVKKVKSRQGFS